MGLIVAQIIIQRCASGDGLRKHHLQRYIITPGWHDTLLTLAVTLVSFTAPSDPLPLPPTGNPKQQSLTTALGEAALKMTLVHTQLIRKKLATLDGKIESSPSKNLFYHDARAPW